MSSTKAPSPRRSAGSTLRLILVPKARVDILSLPERHLLCRLAIGGDDVLVSGAAAEIARKRLADAFVREVELLARFELPDDVHDHARRAVAALQRMAVLKRLLDRVERAVL